MKNQKSTIASFKLRHLVTFFFAFVAVFICSCANLKRSSESGYNNIGDSTVVRRGPEARLSADTKQIAYELGYDPSSTLTNEQINAVYNRKKVRELERTLDTKKEKEQYSKVLPWLRDDLERIQFLSIPNLEGRQSWINNRNIWSRAQGTNREAKDLIENQDIAVGMPMELVKKSWGEPSSVEVSGNPLYKNEKWRYQKYNSSSDGFRQEKRIVYFEAGKVVGWETE